MSVGGHRALTFAVALLAACPESGSSLPDASAHGADAAALLDAATSPDAAPNDASSASSADASAPGPDASSPADAGLALEELHRRADLALQGLLLHFYNQGSDYLKQASDDATPIGYWIFAQGFDAVIDGVERTGGAHFRGLIETFYLDQDAKGWTRDYYDDENWMALALLRAYDLTGQTKYRDRAEALFQDIEAGWDTSCCGATPGGIWWDRPHSSKATASNAGPVITGVRLYQRTGNAAYLSFAQKVFGYWSTHMVDGGTGQIADHVDTKGQVTWWKFTYNEGLMIGAALALYAQGHDPSQLAFAQRTAAFMVAHETAATPDGPVLSDGSGGTCMQFKGIGFRYLAALQAVAPDPAVGAVLDSSARAIWDLARDPSRNVFGTNWAGPAAPASAPVQASVSATEALNVWAELSGKDPAPPPPTYQAEESVLHDLGLEAAHTGFEGWGYVAGWHADGQWIDFHVQVPSAGNWDAELRFAAGAGDASRQIYVNGKTLVANQAFPSTGGWDSWSIQTIRLELPAGESTLSVIFAGSLGSTSYLNLDRLKLTPAP